MKIADIFLIHIFMDLYEIYLKPDTFMCVSDLLFWNLYMFMYLFQMYTYRYPFVCALKYICEKWVISI
jgi:hypothetical protein